MSLAKRNDKQKSKPNPLAPVHLPEFDTSISWAICHNPSCSSFGIPYSGPAPVNWKTGGSVGDRRYRFDIGRRRLHCRNCEHQFRLRSNRAVRSLARYYLSQSLPFADCPNTHCPNHGHNIFEHYHPGKPLRSRRYRRYEEHRAVCRLCGENIRLGEPLAVSRSFQAKKSIREILHGVVRTRSSLSDGIEATGLSPDTYYTRLFRAARRLRDYHAWRNAALLQKKFAGHTQPVRIYSDEMVVSLRRRGEGDRFLPCGLLLTVMRLDDGSLFVLAAHLKFLPDAQGPSEAEFLSAPVDVADPWDSVGNPYRLDVPKSEKRVLDALPDIGRRGHFVKAYYAELAHFLVVRKLLSRFPRVFHYMDRDKELNSAALVAFADAIRGGRWEIANFQHEKEPRSVKAKARDAFEDSPGWRDEGPRSIRERRVENLDREWAAMWKRLEARIDKGGMLKGATRHDPRVLARNYRTAFRGAYAATSKWAWLKHPPQPHQFHDPRVLWTTWNPGKSYESVGRELLWDTNLNPVDSACNALRSRTNGLARRGTRALAGLESASAVWDPRVIDAELWIQILWRNFGLRRKTKRSRPPAKALCLARKSEGNPDLPGLAWDFRLGMSHAEKMSAWCGK